MELTALFSAVTISAIPLSAVLWFQGLWAIPGAFAGGLFCWICSAAVTHMQRYD
jgi:hypothetical protein